MDKVAVVVETVPNPEVMVFHVRTRLTRSLELYLFQGDFDEDDDGFGKKKEARQLARNIRDLDGVEDIHIGRYDVAVTKAHAFSWQELRDPIIKIIKEYISPLEAANRAIREAIEKKEGK